MDSMTRRTLSCQTFGLAAQVVIVEVPDWHRHGTARYAVELFYQDALIEREHFDLIGDAQTWTRLVMSGGDDLGDDEMIPTESDGPESWPGWTDDEVWTLGPDPDWGTESDLEVSPHDQEWWARISQFGHDC